jgi:hypothetical protein
VPGGDFSSNVPSVGVGAGYTSGSGNNINPSIGGGFQSSQSTGVSGGFQVPSSYNSQTSGTGGNAFSSALPSSQSRFGRLAQFGMNSQATQQSTGGGESSVAHLQHFQRQQSFSEQANVVKQPTTGFGRHKF